MRAAARVLLVSAWTAILTGSLAQDIQYSFEVFRSPKVDCVTTPPTVLASFSPAFPAGTRLPRLYYSYAGSMPGLPALEACKAQTSSKQSVTLNPVFEGESQGLLRVLSFAGNCTTPTASRPGQLAVQLVGSQGSEDLGLINCPNTNVCHLYYATITPLSTIKSSDCVQPGAICRTVVKKGIALTTSSDTSNGPCCYECNCKFSHYVQTGKLWNRVRTYYYTCQDPSCFPEAATVEVAGRGRQAITSVRVGDSVLTVNRKTGQPQFSEVYAIPHRTLSKAASFLQVTDSHNRTLLISPGHLMYAAPSHSTRLSDYSALPASSLRVGQYVWSQLPHTVATVGTAGSWSPEYGPARIQAIVHKRAAGMIAPFTMDGTLVVDGMLSSSYATNGLLSATTAHTVLSPLRWVWQTCPAVMHALHREEGDSPALLAAGFSVMDAIESVAKLV